jgi:Na+-transporting NADH:ubiquinone oxidoreductase subunit NqrF
VPGSAPGLLDIVAIHGAAPNGSLFYLSGPPAMIAAFKSRLRDLGVASERVRVDDWE